MKRLFLGCSGRRLFAGDQQNASAKEHAERIRGNAADFDDHFNRFVGLEHVQGRMALARMRPQLRRQISGEILEQFTHIICELACFARRNKGKLGHWR